MSNLEPVLVDTKTARGMLGIGKTKLFELLNSGLLERRKLGRKIGRKTLIPVASIRALAESLEDE